MTMEMVKMICDTLIGCAVVGAVAYCMGQLFRS